MRDHEKETPLYVLCRKWVQNDPETELMPPKLEDPDARDSSAAAASNKLPPVQPPSEEEEQAERPAPEEPPLPQQQRDTPSVEVRKAYIIPAPNKACLDVVNCCHTWHIPSALCSSCTLCIGKCS